MRLIGVLGVLCFAAAPVLGGPVAYTFDVVAGGVDLNSSIGSTSSGMDGTFAVTIYQSDCHIGESDTFILENAYLYNTDTLQLVLAGVATASLHMNSARFMDFAPAEPGHIGPGGQSVVPTDVYVEVTAIVTGAFNTTFDTATWAGTLLPFDVGITTSVERSDVVTASLALFFPYEIGIPDISQTITLDLIVDVVGTAHVVPDPALGGLTALGLGGAGAWLRRRR
jgi:hypothetical protein